MFYFQLISSIESAPGDPFEMCAKSCSTDPLEQARMNAWIVKDTPQDQCAAVCTFKSLKLLKENGDVDIETLSMTQPKLDVSVFKVRSSKAPGFITSVADFINKNREGLAKNLNHLEGLGN